jgi:hypothetical protein
VMAEWRQLSKMAKIFYIGWLISFDGLAIMILTGMTSIDGIWALLKRCPFCMWPKHGDRWTAFFKAESVLYGIVTKLPGWDQNFKKVTASFSPNCAAYIDRYNQFYYHYFAILPKNAAGVYVAPLYALFARKIQSPSNWHLY